MVDELPYAQSTVSGHLKKLKEAGLGRGEVDGPSVCYCIEPRGLELFKRLVEGLVADAAFQQVADTGYGGDFDVEKRGA